MYEDKKKKPGGGKKIEGSYKKKGAAESVKQEKKDLNKMPGDVKQMDTPPARKKGGAKKKGSADYDTSGVKGSHDHPHGGAGRMGFTQNFGAARQNSYAQGAAKVASIMSFGASKKKGAADHIVGHPASEVKLDNIAPSGGVKTSDAKQYIKDVIKSQSEYDVNTTQTSQNLAELDSLKMVASGNSQKAKSLYGYQYTSDKKLNPNFDKSAYDPYMRGHSNPHGKKRIDKYKQLRKDAKEIQGDRPTL